MSGYAASDGRLDSADIELKIRNNLILALSCFHEILRDRVQASVVAFEPRRFLSLVVGNDRLKRGVDALEQG
jgi:hypothetical protein